MKSKILVVAAHPDDEILGCGGTMARLVKEGSEVYTLILGTGITSRYENNEEVEIKDKLKLLKCHAHEANKLIGVNEVITDDFPDNAFDTVALLDIVKSVEKVKDKIKPGLIFTHYEKDLNIDHKITYEAVITAARPMPGETVRQIYSFEVPSSTEWRYPLSFTPDTFYDVGNTIEIKLKALEHYKTEMRKPPHPRSLEWIRLRAKTWGMSVGIEYAEAFKCVRRVQ